MALYSVMCMQKKYSHSPLKFGLYYIKCIRLLCFALDITSLLWRKKVFLGKKGHHEAHFDRFSLVGDHNFVLYFFPESEYYSFISYVANFLAGNCGRLIPGHYV